MKRFLTLAVLLLLTSFSVFSQDKSAFKEYSFTKFFEMIENEPSEEFKLTNALIVFNESTDQDHKGAYGTATEYKAPERQDTIHIRKRLLLENVIFDPSYSRSKIDLGVIHNVVFHEYVRFSNVFGDFMNIHFKNTVGIGFDDTIPEMLKSTTSISSFERLYIQNSVFERDPRIVCTGALTQSSNLFLDISGSTFKSNTLSNDAFFFLRGYGTIRITNNKFEGKDLSEMMFHANTQVIVENNDFGDRWYSAEFLEDNKLVRYLNNNHNYIVGLNLSESTPDLTMDWSQFENGLIDGLRFQNYIAESNNNAIIDSLNILLRDRALMEKYRDSIRIVDNNSFKAEIKLLGILTSIYKRQHDSQSANASYITLKDLETERLEYLYIQNPDFDNFFDWKVNQFLKTISDYGTRPAKAITMSVYVVLLFALIYLFFPNHWDSHGKSRIKDRFLFFHKYLRLNKGIQDVYLEGQSEEIESSHAFRKVLDDHKDEVPAFFYNAAGPLLKWSTAGTMVYSKLLSRIDFLKGSWKDTDPKVRGLKTALTIVIFIIALVYDMLIKMLNALMLSINTFTTLGFGEIPIKGLPRYLAIIQGFIGWFMLTIFSVSLISQLLN